ncbi:MAG: hypothetical protein RIR26_1703 [Pseudomonadota bacterium]|jgi:hypothetical protein
MNATLQKIRTLRVLLEKEGTVAFACSTVTELFVILEPIEFALAGLVLATPFLQPVPLPGLSTPFGLLLAVIGLLQILGLGHASLPKKLRERKIEHATVIKILMYCEKLLLGLEKIPHLQLGKRFSNLVAHPRVLGWHIVFMALMLSLPLPIPLSNSIPAWGIVFSCLAMIESNGFFVLLSYAFLLANVFFFGALVYLGLKILMSDGLRHLMSLEGLEHLSTVMKNFF